ncbi:MAG: hypothetical protein ACR2IT_00170, partial [Pirellulales bacterium]
MAFTLPIRLHARPPTSMCLLVIACLAVTSTPGNAEDWGQPGPSLSVAEPGVTLRGEPAAPLDATVAAAPLDRPAPRTLAEFTMLAEQSHPKLRAARAAIESARGKAVQARLYPNPMAAAGSPQI